MVGSNSVEAIRSSVPNPRQETECVLVQKNILNLYPC
jgi:hypothetical protein